MTHPTDITAAIERLKATLGRMKHVGLLSSLSDQYGEFDNFEDAKRAFATDIELLTSMTQVGWAQKWDSTLDIMTLIDGEPATAPADDWFPVYARVPA